MNLAILVVTYNCLLSESTTLQSLLKADRSTLQHVSLTVWNNGPTLFSSTDIAQFKEQYAAADMQVTLYNTTGNFSLSKIYNHWINENHCSHYIILDHDDLFEADFFTKLHAAKDNDVIVPILKELTIRETTSPTLRVKRKSADYFPTAEGLYTGEKISALTSGLCISKTFIEKFTQHKKPVFNESFALYRIDVCFFNDLTEFRARHKDTTIYICNIIFHCQSEYTEETPAMRHFRELEHVYSGCLIRMHSRKRSRRSAFFFIFRQCLGKFASFAEFKNAVTSVITKRHPKITQAHDQAFVLATHNKLSLIPSLATKLAHD